MNAQDKQFIDDLTRYFTTLTRQGLPQASKVFPDSERCDLDQMQPLAEAFAEVMKHLHATYDAYIALEEGNLSHVIDKNFFLAAPAKAVQSSLKHLVWQVQQIAEGDLSQKVHFMGDLSEAFNALIGSLTVKKELEQRVAIAAQRMSVITAVLGDGVIVTDEKGKVIFCNPAACQLLGYEKSRLLTFDFNQHIHTHTCSGKRLQDDEKPLIGCVSSRRSLRCDDLAFTRSDGRFFPISASFASMDLEIDGSRGVVVAFRDISEQVAYQDSLERMNEILEERASKDVLTRLYNRQYLDKQLGIELDKAERYQIPFSLVLFDIDHFKMVNDSHGHLMGDKVLQLLSDLVQRSIRKSDLLARWGGEEFMLLLPSSRIEAALKTAEKLRQAIADDSFENAQKITCSFGVSEYRHADTVETMTNRADQALYAAKHAGRNCVMPPRSVA